MGWKVFVPVRRKKGVRMGPDKEPGRPGCFPFFSFLSLLPPSSQFLSLSFQTDVRGNPLSSGCAVGRRFRDQGPSRLTHPPFLFANQVFCCPYCNYTDPSAEAVRAHTISQHAVQPKFRCPLCQEQLVGRTNLHFHLSHIHNVVPECVEKLLLVVSIGTTGANGMKVRPVWIPRFCFWDHHKAGPARQ